jgi:hypothetical protein
MTEYIAYYHTDLGYASVWELPSDNIEDDSKEFEALNLSTLADVVTALGDAGWIVVSNWETSRTSSLVIKANVERIIDWDARNNIVSRNEPEFTQCPDCGNLLRTSFDLGWKTHFQYCQLHLARMERENS